MKRNPEILVLALSVLTVLGCRATEPPPVSLITDAGLAYAAAPTANTVRSVWLAKADVSGGVQVATGTQGSFRPSWSPDGESLAFFTQLSRDSTVIETIRGDGTGRAVIVTGLPYSSDPSFSPDGQSIAFSGRTGAAGSEDLHVAARNGSGARALAPAGASDRTPAWSPDGGTIAFTALREEQSPGSGSSIRGLYLINPDGTNLRRLLGHLDLIINAPKWSPDGTRLVFQGAAQGTPSAVYVLTLATGTLLQVTTANTMESDNDPAWTPDGARIVFARSSLTERQLFSVASDGTDLQQITSGSLHYFTPAYRPIPH